jgi:hypothetical protein
MPSGLSLFMDAFWRALAYSLRPGVMALSLVPLVLMVGTTGVLAYFFWESGVAGLGEWLAEWALMDTLLRWLGHAGLSNLRTVVSPLIILMLALPLMVLVALLAVAWLMTPAMVKVVVQRRFPALEARPGGTLLQSVGLSLGSGLLALLGLVLSMPLWLIPPFVVVLPPLIWGWLTYRVMTFDVLAGHATAEERRVLLANYRWWLIAMGVITGYLGAAPGLVWAFGAMAIVFAPLLLPLAIWVYTYVFVLSALWFAHFCLAALAALRHTPDILDAT